MFPSRITAVLLSLTLGLSALGGPASADGFSFTYTPKGDEAKAIGVGLKLYSFTQSRKNRAKVEQNGTGNAAGVSQKGRGNVVGIFQRGKKNTATASQNGDNNALGIFQFGKGNATNVTQRGNDNIGLVFQGGW